MRSWMTLVEVEEFSNDLCNFFPRFLKNKAGCDYRGIQLFAASPNLFHLIDPVCLPGVCLRKMSVKVTSWRVLPRPMEWARMQPKPLDDSNLDGDSMMLSYRKRTPPIWEKNWPSWLKNWVLLNKTYPTDIKTINVIKTSKPNLTYPYFVSSLDPRSCRRGQKVAAEMAGVS